MARKKKDYNFDALQLYCMGWSLQVVAEMERCTRLHTRRKLMWRSQFLAGRAAYKFHVASLAEVWLRKEQLLELIYQYEQKRNGNNEQISEH